MLVRLNPNRLVQFGFEPLDVLSAIGTAYRGTEVAQTYDGNRIFAVSVIMDPADRLDPETLGGLLLQNEQGNLMPLHELASVSLGRYRKVESSPPALVGYEILRSQQGRRYVRETCGKTIRRKRGQCLT